MKSRATWIFDRLWGDHIRVPGNRIHEPPQGFQFPLVPLDLGDQVHDRLLLLLELMFEFSFQSG